MRVTMIRGATRYEFLLDEASDSEESRMEFRDVEAFASFLLPMITDPTNRSEYNALRRNLYSETAREVLRHITSEMELSRRIADVFMRSGGVVRQARSVGLFSPAAPAPPPPARTSGKAAPSFARPLEAPLTELKILEIAFTTDHGKLKNNSRNWKNEGALFPEPEWRPGASHPISHSIDRKVSLRVKFLAGPPEGRTQFGTLRGKGRGHFTFESTRRSIAAGENVLTIECPKELPLQILKREEPLEWSLRLEMDGTLDGGTTGPHVVYCTYDVPKDDRQKTCPEDGVTVRRMEAAIDWAGEVDTMDPHRLVELLMGTFQSYSLVGSKNVPPQYNHPNYRNDEGGAWALSQFRIPGECQAIVRLVMGVIRQVGLPGEAEAIVVYARPEAPTVPKIGVLNRDGGLLFSSRSVEGSTWLAALTDKPVEEGKVYPPPHTPLGADKSPGFNCFEACLKLTHENVTRFYAGGAGIKLTDQEVLECFHQLVWFRKVPHPQYKVGYRVEKVLARYR